MFAWLNRLRHDERGASVVELAVMFPIVLTIGAITIEVGHAMYQEMLIERGLKAAGFFGARNDWPLTSAVETKMRDLAKRGSVDPTAPLLVAGWGDGSASLTVTYKTYGVGNENLPVIQLSASVPYRSLIPGAAVMFGLDGITLSAKHEQPMIGQ